MLACFASTVIITDWVSNGLEVSQRPSLRPVWYLVKYYVQMSGSNSGFPEAS